MNAPRRGLDAPTDLASVRDLLAASDPDGRLVPCDLRELVVGPDVWQQVGALVASVAPSSGRARVAVLGDKTPIRRGDLDLKAAIADLLAATGEVTRVTLDDGHEELHVTDAVVDEALARCADADVLVAVGGGTISDIGKLVAARRPGRRPGLVTVMTAASVDGYTDNVSVTLRDGVKRTVPSVWPDAVLADAQTVAGAPARMNRAGYGEMVSMYVAPADWRLAALVGLDLSFHRGPIALLDALSEELDACAPGVGAGDPDAVQRLTWALALRGIATGVAGSTACLSGVEHLISHMLDLRAAALGRPTGLHGEQVGAGSVVAASAWEMLHDRLAAAPTARACVPEAGRAQVTAAFEALDPSGRIAGECWRDVERKHDDISARLTQINDVLAHWASHGPALRALTRPARTIAAGLRAAGTPALLTDLDPQVSTDVARWAVAHCHRMRNRFTVVDLLDVLGWWEADDHDEVLARAAAAAT